MQRVGRVLGALHLLSLHGDENYGGVEEEKEQEQLGLLVDDVEGAPATEEYHDDEDEDEDEDGTLGLPLCDEDSNGEDDAYHDAGQLYEAVPSFGLAPQHTPRTLPKSRWYVPGLMMPPPPDSETEAEAEEDEEAEEEADNGEAAGDEQVQSAVKRAPLTLTRRLAMTAASAVARSPAHRARARTTVQPQSDPIRVPRAVPDAIMGGGESMSTDFMDRAFQMYLCVSRGDVKMTQEQLEEAAREFYTDIAMNSAVGSVGVSMGDTLHDLDGNVSTQDSGSESGTCEGRDKLVPLPSVPDAHDDTRNNHKNLPSCPQLKGRSDSECTEPGPAVICHWEKDTVAETSSITVDLCSERTTSPFSAVGIPSNSIRSSSSRKSFLSTAGSVSDDCGYGMLFAMDEDATP